MTTGTSIEWTDHTFNPWWGCSRVSPACRFCYAERLARRYGHDIWHQHGPRRMLSDTNWRDPVKWNRNAERAGVPARVFAGSMCDVFEDHPQLPEPRARLWALLEATPWLRWQLLTKRPENVTGMVPPAWVANHGTGWPPHVWLGTSTETQPYAEARIPKLLSVLGVPVYFLSVEPLLGPVSLGRWLNPDEPDADCDGCGIQGFYDPDGHPVPDDEQATTGGWCNGPMRRHPSIGWVIAGGESGPKARPMHPAWARKLRDECATANVQFFFKQWGHHIPDEQLAGELPASARKRARPVTLDSTTRTASATADSGVVNGAAVAMYPVGKDRAGRLLDGRTWDQVPDLTIPRRPGR